MHVGSEPTGGFPGAPSGQTSIEHQFGSSEEEMTDREQLRGSNLEKDPGEWKTGDEPMTGAQASYLKTLSDQAGEQFEEDLSKAEASRRIDRLQERTGRGR
jgi:phage tail tube protein FII